MLFKSTPGYVICIFSSHCCEGDSFSHSLPMFPRILVDMASVTRKFLCAEKITQLSKINNQIINKSTNVVLFKSKFCLQILFSFVKPANLTFLKEILTNPIFDLFFFKNNYTGTFKIPVLSLSLILR